MDMKKDLLIYFAFVALVLGLIFYFGLKEPVGAVNIAWCDALTGEGSRDLDSINSGASGIANGDVAFVFDSGESRFFVMYYDSGTSIANNTTTHPFIVAPVDDPESGVWRELSGISAFGAN